MHQLLHAQVVLQGNSLAVQVTREKTSQKDRLLQLRQRKVNAKTDLKNIYNNLVTDSHMVQEAPVARYAQWDPFLNFQVVN